MTRYLLDTNIISETIKPWPSPLLAKWFENQRDDNLFISSLTLAEIRRGILDLPKGKKRDALHKWFLSVDGPSSIFRGRILPFNETAAFIWAELMVEGKKIGRPRDGFDMIIASVARANDCIIVTNNEKDFVGLKIINPLREL